MAPILKSLPEITGNSYAGCLKIEHPSQKTEIRALILFQMHGNCNSSSQLFDLSEKAFKLGFLFGSGLFTRYTSSIFRCWSIFRPQNVQWGRHQLLPVVALVSLVTGACRLLSCTYKLLVNPKQDIPIGDLLEKLMGFPTDGIKPISNQASAHGRPLTRAHLTFSVFNWPCFKLQ